MKFNPSGRRRWAVNMCFKITKTPAGDIAVGHTAYRDQPPLIFTQGEFDAFCRDVLAGKYRYLLRN